MGEETLVETQLAETVSLLQALEAQGDKPSSVVWHYFPDAEEWRLLLAGPAFDNLLPKAEAQAYQRVAAALSKSPASTLSIGEVKLVKTDDPLLQAMRFLVRTGPDAVVRAHFRDNMINGVFIKEMFVLRAA